MVFAGVFGFASGDARFFFSRPWPPAAPSVPLCSSSIWDEGWRGRVEEGRVRGWGMRAYAYGVYYNKRSWGVCRII